MKLKLILIIYGILFYPKIKFKIHIHNNFKHKTNLENLNKTNYIQHLNIVNSYILYIYILFVIMFKIYAHQLIRDLI